MMTKQTEALHKALKVLNCLNNDRVYETAWVKGAINACEEALEQPAQEPVAWNEEEFNAIAYAYRTCPAHEIKMVSDRYQELVNYVLSITHPAPSWQGLSDDEIHNLMIGKNGVYYNFARVIEQALKEKNNAV